MGAVEAPVQVAVGSSDYRLAGHRAAGLPSPAMSAGYEDVAVLMGGPSAEREVSLRSGAAVAGALRICGYRVAECDPTETDLRLPAGVKAVFIALHGAFGEDGTVQSMLRDRGIPYTGAGPEASRLAFDKVATKRRLLERGLPTPAFECLKPGDARTLELPVIVKPSRQGSSIGLFAVTRAEEWDEAMAGASRFDDEVLVEAFIDGAELTVGVVGDEILPVVEIRAPGGRYDYAAKYTTGKTRYLVPAPLDPAIARHCAEVARGCFDAIGCTGLGRVDIRLAPGGQPFILEINTIPGFTETSLLPKAAVAAGIDFPALCRRILQSASVH